MLATFLTGLAGVLLFRGLLVAELDPGPSPLLLRPRTLTGAEISDFGVWTFPDLYNWLYPTSSVLDAIPLTESA